jgi:hypothetical protein
MEPQGSEGRRYAFIEAVLGEQEPIEIARSEYEKIVRAKKGLDLALALEEKFNLLLENYSEYEAELLRLALRESVFRHRDWPSFQDAIYAVNRRIVNLVSAARLYFDQIDRDLREFYGPESAAAGLFRSKRASEYDSNLAYRVMEALRNHIQHKSLPVHEYSVQFAVDEPGSPGSFIRHSVKPVIQVSVLAKDTEFKREVLSQLSASGKSTVSLTMLIRRYLASIAKVQAAVRGAMTEDVEEWCRVLDAAMARCRSSFGETPGAVAILDRHEDGEDESGVEHLNEEVCKRREYLIHRTSGANHLDRGFVTNKIDAKDA